MSEIIELYLIIVLIYLLECIALIEESSLLVYSSWFNFKTSYKEGIYKWGSKYIKFLNPLLPYSDVFITECPSISFSPIGISSRKSNELQSLDNNSTTRTFFTYAEIEKIYSDENKIYINDKLFICCSSSFVAKYAKSFLKDLKESSTELIEQKIDGYLNAMFDIEKLNTKYELFTKKTFYLKLATQIYWFYLFIILPVLVFKFDYFLMFEQLLITLAFLHLMTITILFLIHKSIYSRNSTSEFKSSFFKIILSPLAACWANITLSKEYLVEFHPIVVLKNLVVTKDFVHYGSKIVREYRFFADDESLDEMEHNILKWNRDKFNSKIEKFLREQEYDLQEFLLPVTNKNQNAKSYCPRCLVEYTFESGNCSDCYGIRLIQLKEKYNYE